MISDLDLDLDRLLVEWLRAGPEKAAREDVAAALARVAATTQRRSRFAVLASGWTDPRIRRSLVLTGLVILVAILSIVGLVAGGPPAVPISSPVPSAIARPTPVASVVAIDPPVATPVASSEATPVGPDVRYVMADGRVELELPSDWADAKIEEGKLRLGTWPLKRWMWAWEIDVRSAVIGSRLETCDTPAGPWELCPIVDATTVDALVAALEPAPAHDGSCWASANSSHEVIDGEPAVVVRIVSCEPEALGVQWVFYLVVRHEDRLYLVRLWTDKEFSDELEPVISGFSFVD